MKRLAIVGGVALVMAATACSTSSRDSSNEADGSSATVRGVTADSVKVGGLIYKTSSFGASVANTELGAKARFDRANAEGGVNGRKIDFVGAEDDNADNGKNLAAARRLVEQERVFAIVPVNTFAFTAGKYLATNRVPFFGYGYMPDFCGEQNQFGYGFNGCLYATPGAPLSQQFFYSLAKALGGPNGKVASYIGTDHPTDKPFKAQFAAAAKSVGFGFAGFGPNIPQPNTPTDWSPYVNAFKELNNGTWPDIIYSNAPSASVNTGLFAALRAGGFKGILSDGVSYRRNVLENAETRAAYQGVYIGVGVQPVEVDSPEIDQLKEDIDQAAGKPTQVDLDMEIGYATADVFLQALEKAGKALTVEKFVETAKSAQIEGAISGPVTFPEGFRVGQLCAAMVQVEGSEFKVAQALTCGPAINAS